ncbi:MAG: hypothetical protein H9536_01135 [Aphanizomenon flos-aquae Clear-A1]|nr:hypothetical protein [Aphanizomenon flos-aquae Clear-A1]
MLTIPDGIVPSIEDYRLIFNDVDDNNKLIYIGLDAMGRIEIKTADIYVSNDGSEFIINNGIQSNTKDKKHNNTKQVAGDIPTLEDWIRPNKLIDLNKTSLNCFHTTIGRVFAKIQAYNEGDSLVGETYYTLRLEEVLNDPLMNADALDIFPKVVGSDYGKIVHQNNNANNVPLVFQGLKTVAYQRPATLYDRLNACTNVQDMERASRDVYALIITYLHYANVLGEISHNDLHMGNMLYDTLHNNTSVLKFIDLGRMYLKDESFHEALFKHVCNKFDIDTEDNACMQKAIKSHLVNKHQCKGKMNYMCDIMSIVLSTVQNIGYTYPEWCLFDSDDNGEMVVTIDYNKLKSKPPKYDDLFGLGLAWFTCCIFAYMKEHGNNRAIHQHIPYETITDYTILMPNNVVYVPWYDIYGDRARKLFEYAVGMKTLTELSENSTMTRSGGVVSNFKTNVPVRARIRGKIDNRLIIPTGYLLKEYAKRDLQHIQASNQRLLQSSISFERVQETTQLPDDSELNANAYKGDIVLDAFNYWKTRASKSVLRPQQQNNVSLVPSGIEYNDRWQIRQGIVAGGTKSIRKRRELMFVGNKSDATFVVKKMH